MQILKKPAAFILIISLVISLSPMTVMAKAGTEHEVGSIGEMDTALGSLASGDTIKLTANIDYPQGISIDNMDIVFDLNGYVLNISTNSGIALSVTNGGDLQLTEDGEFNVATEADSTYTVLVSYGSTATVTSVSAIGNGSYGAYVHDGGDLTVKGNVEASGNACRGISLDGGKIKVEGNITATGDSSFGANCEKHGAADSAIEIHGKIMVSGIGCYGVNSLSQGSSIDVGGDINTSGDYSYGACAQLEGSISVSGSVSADGAGSTGVLVTDVGLIEVDQDIAASGAAVKGIAAYSNGTVKVANDALATGGDFCYGAYAEGGIINIEGDAKASGGSDCVGAKANSGGTLIVNGSAIAEGQRCHGADSFSSGSSIKIVQNAIATGDDCVGASAASEGSIEVHGSVTAEAVTGIAASTGVSASEGGKVTVRGNAAASGTGSAGAYAENGTIIIDGNVEAIGETCVGNKASNHGEINIIGNVNATGSPCQGALCSNSSSIKIAGNLIASGTGCTGADSEYLGTVLVGGNIHAYGDYCKGAYTVNDGFITVSGSAIADGNGSHAVYAETGANIICVGQDVVASGLDFYAVYAASGSLVKVGHNVSTSGISSPFPQLRYGAYAAGGTVTVGGDIVGNGNDTICAGAYNAGTLTVSGSAVAEGSNSRGAYADGLSSSIVIGQNITDVGDSCYGALASDGGKVIVNKNVTVAAVTAYGGVYGARAESGGMVTVSGIVAAIGSQSWGASVEHAGSSLFIEQSVAVTGEYSHGVSVSGSAATVKGDITIDGNYSAAAETDHTGTITVIGNIKANGVDSGGVLADHNSTATVSGIITSKGTNNRGASAANDSVVTVDGGIDAICPIILDGFNIDSSTPSAIGNYLIYVNAPKAAAIRIKLPMTPLISANPQDLNLNEGEPAEFTAAAIVSDGGTLKYQWQKSTDGGIKWGDIYGATGVTFSITHVAAGDDGSKYRCGFRNDKNKGSSITIYTSAASMTVTPAAVTPTILVHPTNLTIISGGTDVVTISAIAADGGNLTYQWQVSRGAISWSNISGATGSALTIAAVVIEDNGSQYRCVVTNTKNGTLKSTNSNAATLTVNSPPAKILVSIPTPAAITGLPNGTTKTAIAMGLPTTVTMKTNSGDVSSGVNWSVASCSYNPSAAAAQTFDVTGTAILPAGVVNTNSVPLTVSISVSVSAKAADNTGGKSSSSSKPGTKAMIKMEDGKTDMIPINIFNGSASVSLNSAVNEIEMPDIKNVNQYALEMPASALSLKEEEKRVGMTSKIGVISIPDNMLNGSGINGAEKVKISMGEGDRSGLSKEVQEQIGIKPLIELRLSTGDKAVEWNNPSAPVNVSIPYTPTAAELKDPEHIVVWYIDGKGNIVDVPSGRYDAETGMVTFSTTHFSRYAIAYVTKTFNDLGAAEWARKPVEILASKGIVEGLTDREYAPKKSITRGDYLCFLVRALNIETSFDESFADVSSDAYNYREIGIAKKLGIAAGAGKNQFHPEEEITRQDMMVLTDRTLKMLSNIESENRTTSLGQFSDSNKIAVYAKNSVDSLVKEGLITGSGNRLNPRGNTTRAEAAVFLYRIYEKYNRPVK